MTLSGIMPAILNGLFVTLTISLFSLVIAVVPGSLLFMGKNSKSPLLKLPCNAYIYLFDGVPLLLQIFFFYYALPMAFRPLAFPGYATGVLILSLNAIALLAVQMDFYTLKSKENPGRPGILKLLVLSALYVFAELLKYSTLLSLIGLTELLRISGQISNRLANASAYLIAIGIFLVLNTVLKLLVNRLYNVFFPEQEPRKVLVDTR